MTSDKVNVHQFFSNIAQGLTGSIPIAGSVLKPLTGLLFDWLDGSPNPWIEFESKINRLINNKINNQEAMLIRNNLNGFDAQLNLFFKEYDDSYSRGKLNSEINGFRIRIGALADRLSGFSPHIMNPSSFSTTVPYFEHYFLLCVSVYVIGEEIEVKSYDFRQRRKDLYQMTSRYLYNACYNISEERQKDIVYKNFNTGSNKRIGNGVYDEFQGKRITEGLFGWPSSVTRPLLPALKKAAGVSAVAQTMRYPIINVASVIDSDNVSGITGSEIRHIYELVMSDIFVRFLNDWNAYALRNIRNSGVINPDIGRLASTSSSVYENVLSPPVKNIFHINHSRD
ncbi:hypothetical protein [Enterobacter hormaechei]|uniref:hypothetical protein n=1 Tax=Enterobacter hormaechei TaxID=158836 RepID=UPI00254AAC14|nr:hypothetical protein [Enterobacter hormaechei]MDK9637834.1 hypothetical protein [Enterobacter hormaechei]